MRRLTAAKWEERRVLRHLHRANVLYALDHPETFDPARLREALRRLEGPTKGEIDAAEGALNP